MPVKSPIFLLLLLACALLSRPAVAASCWITQGASTVFGTLVAGNTSSTQTSVKFSCYADYGETRYFNVCLSSLESAPFKMTSNGDNEGKQYTMLFRLFSALDNSQELTSLGAGRALQTALTIGGNLTSGGSFPLLATIPSGQNDLPVRSYFNYTLGLKLTWNSATQKEALTSCQDGASQGLATDLSSNASATLSDSCFIQSVTPLDFGIVGSTALTGQLTSTATLRARCPVGTRYTLGISDGAHASGSQRQMCNDRQQCLQYALWQDASATVPWGDRSASNTMEVTHPDGNVQSITVYGTVPPQTLSGTGAFSDDVVITLTY
ncbi:spore coat U domain-containing protein [Kluyvera genomosp. 2]|uniref:Csu type fimbrial protein n=1 Tax=Kluyvera genomosp. 2 TaxID=2774054 RepID=UPI002FD80DF2